MGKIAKISHIVREAWREEGPGWVLSVLWMRFWMRFAGTSRMGRLATSLASFAAPPYYGRSQLSWWNKKGFISPRSEIYHSSLSLGKHIFIDDRVVIYQAHDGGQVELGERVSLLRDVIVQTGEGGRVRIGRNTCIQPRVIISAFLEDIHIGEEVQIAPNCSFYSYNHGTGAESSIGDQPLRSRGPIIIEDGVWIGAGATVLNGVRIGTGAVIGAGSVVTRDIPDYSIAHGVPAKAVRSRRPVTARIKA